MRTSHADAFYGEIVEASEVWCIRSRDHIPAPADSEGLRAVPFWSKRNRAQRVIESAGTFAGFEPFAIPMDEWRSRWLRRLRRDGILVRLNWSGTPATASVMAPDDVERGVAAFIARDHERPLPGGPHRGVCHPCGAAADLWVGYDGGLGVGEWRSCQPCADDRGGVYALLRWRKRWWSNED